MNDGPLCRCSSENMHYGIRHNIYPGEKVNLFTCVLFLCCIVCWRMMIEMAILSLHEDAHH